MKSARVWSSVSQVVASSSRRIPALSTFSVMFLLVRPAFGFDAESPGSDVDLTRPVTRFHLRDQIVGKDDGVIQDKTILRLDHVVSLSEQWKIGGRVDVPLMISNDKSSDNPSGRTRFGTGDLLTQVVFVHLPTERFAYGVGLRLLLPTASEDEFGDGKWQLLPLMGARFSLPGISAGSFIELQVRYGFDANGDSGRKHVSQLRMSPTFNVELPQQWFVTLFPSQDITLDLVEGHRWFVPVDVLIGKKVSAHSSVGLEVSIPIIKDYPLYHYKVEARFSLSF